jgi:hypothetical protein
LFSAVEIGVLDLRDPPVEVGPEQTLVRTVRPATPDLGSRVFRFQEW